MSEEGILGEKDLMTLCAVMNLADPVATTGAACCTCSSFPCPCRPVDLVPGDGLGLGHALVIADQKLKYAANDVRKVPNLKRYAAKSSL